MTTVVCKNQACPYHTKADFCSKELVSLNAFGGCLHWWNAGAPQMRPSMWDYADLRPEDITPNYEAAEELDKDADEQQLPQEEKSEDDNKNCDQNENLASTVAWYFSCARSAVLSSSFCSKNGA